MTEREIMNLADAYADATFTQGLMQDAGSPIPEQKRKALVKAIQAMQEPKVCRPDGRCQYAIDSGAEGLGHCPVGKCCMPDVEQQDCRCDRLTAHHTYCRVITEDV